MIDLKLKHWLMPSVVALTCCTSPLRAEDRPANNTVNRIDRASDPTTQTSPQEKSSSAATGQHLITTMRANKLIGMDVRNNQNEKVGDVNNFIVDLTNGRVIAAIISSGGFLGIGDTLSAVPPQALRVGTERNALLLDVTKEALTSYPHFKKSEWPEFGDPAYLTRVYRSYQIEPYFSPSGEVGTVQTTTTVAVPLGYGLRADKLIGMNVRNNQQEKIGDVDNLAIDLANGRVVMVVVSSGGFLGIGDTLSAVPPQAFRLNTERNGLLLDVNKETLTRYPHFKANEWAQLDDPNYIAQIYQAYNVPPYWKTTEAVGGTSSPSTTGALQSSGKTSSRTDAASLEQVRKAINEGANLSADARNINVSLDQGKIKVQGTVNTDEEKNRVIKMAHDAAPGAEFNFDVRVK